MLEALEFSKYVLAKAENIGYPISNFQLQQMLYIIQRYLVSNDKYAFEDYFHAWRLGPVVPAVYNEFSYYAGTPIKISRCCEQSITLPFEPIYIDVINEIITKYSEFRPYELQKIVCVKDGAWETVYDSGKGIKNIIPYLLIKKENEGLPNE